MGPWIFKRGLLASLVALLATFATAQDATPTNAPGAIQTIGCYSNANNLKSVGPWTFQTSGYCQTQCANLGKPVMAITQGSTCFCGDTLPSSSYETDSSSCNSPCNGFGQDMCGGLGYWTVYLTGLDVLVSTASAESSSAKATSTTGSTSSTASSPAVITKPGETVVVTASAAPIHSSSSSSGGGSKVGIAIGVVVGVLAVAAIVGAAVLYTKQRKRRALEQEHRRNAAISALTGKGDQKTPGDQRLDPNNTSQFRRDSLGSIADERDFSRRILAVRNPDANRNSSMSGLGV